MKMVTLMLVLACAGAMGAEWEAPEAAEILCPSGSGEAEQKQAAALAKKLQSLAKTMNTPDSKGQTALMFAVMQDNRLAACYLIAKQADTMRQDKSGKSASDYARRMSLRELLSACLEKNETIAYEGRMKIIREMGLDDPEKCMARLKDLAGRPGSLPEMATVLKAAGMDMDWSKAPALHALPGVTPECLALLVRKGYSVNTPGEDGKVSLPLMASSAKLALALGQKPDDLFAAAVLANRVDAVKAMLKDDAMLATRGGKSALPMLLAQSAEMVQALKEAGADTQGCILQIIADQSAEPREAEVVQALVTAGAQPDAQALLILCRDGSAQVQTAQVLLRAGLKADTTDEKGNTALHYAAARGNAALIKLLLSQEADANAVNTEGDTPLLYLLKNGAKYALPAELTSATKALLKGGANPKAKTKDGQNALKLAKSLGHEYLAKVIKAGAK